MRLIILITALILVLGCAQQQAEQLQEPDVIQQQEVIGMKITSAAFKEGGAIPSKYTCDGDDSSPPLIISDVPKNAKTLALISDDPDAPMGTWVHWVVWNIPADTKEIAEGEAPGEEGTTDFGRTGYGGPCPPSGTHRYFFKLYALDTELNLPGSTTKKQLESAMKGHVVAEAKLIGTYKR